MALPFSFSVSMALCYLPLRLLYPLSLLLPLSLSLPPHFIHKLSSMSWSCCLTCTPPQATVPKPKTLHHKSTAPSWNNVTHNLACKLSREHFCLTCPYMDLGRPVWEEWVHSWWIYMQNIAGSLIAPRLLMQCVLYSCCRSGLNCLRAKRS